MRTTLTSNGTINAIAPRDGFAIKVSGIWGAGTLTIGLENADGSYSDFAATYTADVEATVNVGKGTIVGLTLSGATAPSLAVHIV